ncbi:MAG TPA: pectinesterase family protein [Verrucomicrobiae bacterium]|nr:pectinesterase family protein [Verrucomicrobiae bacterium]
MKRVMRTRLVTIFFAVLLAGGSRARAQNIFVDLLTGTAAPVTSSNIAPPSGYSYSAAAPVGGNNWNTVGESATVPLNTTVGSTVIVYTNLPLKDCTGTSITPTLTVSYFSKVTTGTRVQPSNSSGENTIQPGGVMQQSWRNYYNASGNFFIFSFANLTPSALYGIYIEGGTTTSGQGVGVALSNANYYAVASGNPTNVTTANTTANSNGAYGSLWTTNSVSGGFQLLPQGSTWGVLYGQADASGNFGILFNGLSSAAYLSGFQLVALSAPGLTGPTNQTIVAGNNATISASVSGLPAPALQWQANGTNIAGATGSSLILTNVQASQSNFVYSLVASNIVGAATNSMMLTVIVMPGIGNLTNQTASIGDTVVISPSISGVPAPSLQWQLGGTNLVDGATGNGSTITGSTSSTLTITDAQAADSGSYCLIASNAAGVVTSCMNLTVSGNSVPPGIVGPTDQTTVQGNTATFSASVSGLPTPTQQWYDNGVPIPGATGESLILTNVQYLTQNGHTYSIIATNEAGSASNSAVLYVLVPPTISAQPQSLVITNTQGACFSVVSTDGVPAATFQWYFNNALISGATSSTFCIASAVATNMGTYYVVASNSVGGATSIGATLTVDSMMTALSLSPTNGATGVCYDTPLYITFDQPPLLRDLGMIRIYDTTNPASPIDTLDMSQNFTNDPVYAANIQARTIGGTTFSTFPVIIAGDTAAIYPHLDLLTSNQTYYVTVDPGVFTDTNGALFVGITGTNVWQFATKPTGPANPTNIVVAADGSGDFLTVQGAIDFVPNNNTIHTLINIRNGTYTEVINIRSKNNLTLRGQSRAGTVIAYANNGHVNASTHQENVVTVNGNDIAIDGVTLNDTSGYGASPAQALMLETNIKRFIFNNSAMSSFQDTMLGNTSGTQAYFNNSLIEGQTDFIWGGMNAFFTNCEIRCRLSGSHCTQSRTDAGSNGIAVLNCRLTRSSNAVVNCDLGRAISISNGNAFVAFCLIDDHIISNGWNGTDASISRYWTYGNSNINATAARTFPTDLTNGDPNVTCVQNVSCWLNGWQPQLAPNILTNPVSMTVTAGTMASFYVSATGVPDPSYQWLLNGTNVINATANSATLVISNALAGDAGAYYVIVSNSAGVVNSDTATLTVVGTAPTASFTASPTSGLEPLAVTFTDTSSGSPNITLFWDLGDGSQATNAGGASFVHTYAAGRYTVTLTASNAFGPVSTLVSNNLINVITAYSVWQSNYFGCTICPQAQPDADPYGKGMINSNQFLAGFNPTNTAAYLHVISVVATNGTDINVIFLGASGDSTYVPGVASRTNRLEYSTGAADGSYNNAFTAVPGVSDIILGGGTGLGAVTNFTDAGGATNVPSRYYRVRVLLP